MGKIIISKKLKIVLIVLDLGHVSTDLKATRMSPHDSTLLFISKVSLKAGSIIKFIVIIV